MSVLVWIALAVVLIGGYAWYATIVARRNRVDEAMSGIDVQLKQRHDLIPNVLAIARRYMEHERGLLDDIVALRTGAQQRQGERDPAKMDERFQTEA